MSAPVVSLVRSVVEVDPYAVPPPAPQPTFANPFQGLAGLEKVAIYGRDAILAAAAHPPVYIWEGVTEAGTVNLFAGAPGSGKTTLLFNVIAARINHGDPVHVLGRLMQPAPERKCFVVIEAEHQEGSACRMLLKSLRLLGVDDLALDRVIVVARKAVRVGSSQWEDVVKMVEAGVVSDIALDTLARVAPSDANSEADQIEVFEKVAQAIEASPKDDIRPTVWIAAHCRKGRGGDAVPTLEDVSGSTQRAGQADVVLCMAAQHKNDVTSSVRVAFRKIRERDADDAPKPVEYEQTKAGIRLINCEGAAPCGEPEGFQGDILKSLKGKPMTLADIRRVFPNRNGTDVKATAQALASAGWIELNGDVYSVSSEQDCGL